MSLAQRLKDALPHEIKRKVREIRHRDDTGLYSAMLSINQDSEVIFDVGANFGNLSLAFCRWFPKATVHGFEPEALHEYALARFAPDIIAGHPLNVHAEILGE